MFPGLRARRSAAILIFAVLTAAGVAGAQSPVSPVKKLQLEARAAVAQLNWDVALDRYQRALKLAPRDPELQTEMAAVYKAMGRYPEAIAAFEKALTLSAHNEGAELGLADAYRLTFNYDQARKTMERARQEHPRSAAPLMAMGELDIQFQKYDEAILHLQQALRFEPENLAARNDLALAYHGKSEPDKALELVNVTLERDSNSTLALFLRGTILAERNENDRALPDAEKLFELEPEKARARLLLGKLQVRTGKCAEAVVTLAPITKGPEESSEALYLLWQAYHCTGQTELAQRAMARFEDASKRDHQKNENKAQGDHLVNQAAELARRNQFPQAIDLLQQAIKMNPRNGIAYSQLAKIYFSEGHIQEAHDTINKALELSPYHPDYLYVLGKILEREGKLDEALRTFEQITLIRPEESDSYYEMGLIYQQRKDRARAVAAFKKAVDLSPDDPDYRRALAAASSGADSP